MSYTLLTEPVFFRIEGGIVFVESGSGHDPLNLSMSLSEFRKAIAAGVQALRAFDASHEVVAIQTERARR